MNQQLNYLENVGLPETSICVAFTSHCSWEHAGLQLVHASVYCPWMQIAMPQVTPGGRNSVIPLRALDQLWWLGAELHHIPPLHQ